MRELAVYERYIDQFRVTESDIIENGLSASPRFGIFVAEMDGDIIGIAVHYEIPWTYDLKPVLVLKELFVSKHARTLGAGRALLTKIEKHALEIDASRIVWTVLKDNVAAKQFYEKAGGQKDAAWELWELVHSIKAE
jgi:diamine N-acetyltransferase|tara:strand:+ start:2438 stop:2848 length:411 start_codon:yes stop_codon:yes gene_type:complete